MAIDPLLSVGDVVLMAGRAWVVGTVTQNPGQPAHWWQLFLVPVGKNAADLGVTWKRTDVETEGLMLTRAQLAPLSTNLEPPAPPLTFPPPPLDA